MKLFRKKSTSQSSEPEKPDGRYQVLVIQQDDYDWEEIMKDAKTKDGKGIRIIQTSFEDLLLGPCDNYSTELGSRIHVDVRRLWKNGRPLPESFTRGIRPSLLLARNVLCTVTQNHRNTLYGFEYAGVPMMNSFHAQFMNSERAVVVAAMSKLARQLGRENFPLISQAFFASESSFFYGLPFPCVTKLGSGHAGYGKLKVANHHDMQDVRTLLPMTKDGYATAETFIEADYELRLQKLGTHLRAFKKVGLSGHWKTNTGTCDLVEIPVTEQFEFWLDQASSLFGGMELCTLDVLHDKLQDKYFILELNGGSSGLSPYHAVADNKIIGQMVIDKLNQLYCGDST